MLAIGLAWPSFESRTRIVSVVTATSTQAPLALLRVLLRQRTLAKSGASIVGLLVSCPLVSDPADQLDRLGRIMSDLHKPLKVHGICAQIIRCFQVDTIGEVVEVCSG